MRGFWLHVPAASQDSNAKQWAICRSEALLECEGWTSDVSDMKQWLDGVVMQGGGRLGCSALPGNTASLSRVLKSVLLWGHAFLLSSQHSSAQKTGSCLHSCISVSWDCVQCCVCVPSLKASVCSYPCCGDDLFALFGWS